MKLKVTVTMANGKGMPIRAFEYPVVKEGDINIKGATLNHVVLTVDELHEKAISFHVVSGKEKARTPAKEGSIELTTGNSYSLTLSSSGAIYTYSITLDGTISKAGIEFAKKLQKRDPDTLYQVGLAMIEGTDKVEPNPEKGLEIIEEAASLGSQDAKEYLETEYFDDNASTQAES